MTAPGKLALILPLLLLGAAASPSDCSAPPSPGTTLPIPLDLAGRPIAGPGLTAPPAMPSPLACGGPTAAASSGLDGLPTDVLHGLPGMDLLRGPLTPQVRPEFE